MAKITIVAKIVANRDAVATVKPELVKLIAPTRSEAGCLEYRFHQDTEDPCVFIFYENWEDLASLERHMNSAHFRHYLAAVEGKIAAKVVHKLTELV